MEKRYQVFVSSTFKDLSEERAIVKKALLEMKCFPAGMEEFPALDIEQFEYIKSQVDSSDYYILILGGSVGSIDTKSGKSYTYLEFEYTQEKGVPIIAFIKKNEQGEIYCNETSKERKNIYLNFVKAAETNRLCKYFINKDELSGMTHFGMNEQIKNFPRPGWKRDEEYIKRYDKDLILKGNIIEEFHIGKEIYSALDQFYPLQSISTLQNKAWVKYGVDSQGMFKLLFMNNMYAHNFWYDIKEEFFEYGELKTHTIMQISIAKLGNVDEPLLFFSVGNRLCDMFTKVYRIGLFELKEIYEISGQSEMIVDYDICVPYGSQGLFERYVYCKGELYHV